MSPLIRHALVTGIAALALVSLGCDEQPQSPSPTDRGPIDGPLADATADAAVGTFDTGAADGARDADRSDGMSPPDGMPPDAGPPDGAVIDAALPDAALPDAALPDMALPDMVPPDDGPPPLAPPQITEVAARDGAGLLDEDGEPADWIELFNPNPAPYPLAGHHLTDDADDAFAWTLPAVAIPPGGYRVIFASGKDRTPLDGPLHTNFRLAAEGEYLALTDPDGEVLDAWDGWPPQIEGATYGRPMTVERNPIASGPARLAPLPLAPMGWTAPDFDDSRWLVVDLPVGYDRAGPPPPDAEPDAFGPLIADTVADWSPAGIQGAHNWTYGYTDRTAAGPGPYVGEDFVPFPRDGGGYSPTDFWNGTSYAWFAGNPPWTLIGQRDVHPNGSNNNAEHWPIRRFTAATGGAHVIEWRLYKTNPNGTGVTGRILRTGPAGTAEIDATAIEGHDVLGAPRRIAVALAAGDTLDFAVDATGPEGDRTDFSDGSAFEARIWQAPDLGALIATPLDWPESTGAALRVPIDVPLDAERIELALTYDDAFAAWIDGAPLAGDGAPPPVDADGRPIGEPAPDARAAADRPSALALRPTIVAVDGLAPGPQVLALAGFDGPLDDGRFALGVEAFDLRRAIGPERRFLAPTPGADNSLPLDIGPVVFELSRDPPAVADAPLEISARVQPTTAPIASVQLTWRVAYQPPQTIELAPDADSDVYRARLPADVMLPGELIRWFVEATDDQGRITREPPFPHPLDSAQYFGTVVDDPTIESDLPVLHWFIERPDLANRESGTRSTLWFGGELYDNVRVDLHGQSTRGFPKKSYDVDLNRDHRFRLRDDLRRMKDFNLLSDYADKSRVRNTLAYDTLAAVGADHHLAFPIRIQQNRGFFSVADFVEDGDDRWMERLGYDPVGPLYKVYDGAYDANRGEKKTRKDEGNEDYAALIRGLSLPPDERRLFLYDKLDLARMANYLAGSFMHGAVDCCHKNYYLYQDATRAEWWMLTWDVDLSFGRVWTGSYFDDTMYPENGLFIGRDTGAGNQLLRALYQDPAFVEMYLRRTRTLIDTVLQPPGTPPEDLILEARVDAITDLIGEDAILDADRWPTWGEPQTMLEAARRLKDDFLAPRRAWVYGSLVEHDPGVTLIPGEPGAAMARYRVPAADDPELLWTRPDFDDADWAEGPLGLGYENAPAEYDPLIATEVRPTDVAPGATTVQLRIPFVVDDPDAIESLNLAMKYDDGFVAWLNGIEIARRNIDGLPSWNASASNHDDNRAVQFEGIAIDAFDALRPGLNTLAIQVVNAGANSSDLLIQPALVDGFIGAGILPVAQPADAIAHAVAMAGADDPAEAWVAVANPGPEAIDISDWILRGAGVEHRFVPGTVIPAGGEMYVVADARRFRSRAESPTGGEGHFVQGNWRGQLVPAFGLPEIITPDGRVMPAP